MLRLSAIYFLFAPNGHGFLKKEILVSGDLAKLGSVALSRAHGSGCGDGAMLLVAVAVAGTTSLVLEQLKFRTQIACMYVCMDACMYAGT